MKNFLLHMGIPFFLAALFLGSLALADQSRALVRSKQPTYPELARRMNLSGTVTLKVEVGADGKVKSVSVLSGNPLLGRAASDAVREWVYVPGVDESRTVSVNFDPSK